MAAASASASTAKPGLVTAFSAVGKRLAGLLDTQDLLSLLGTCSFFHGPHGERMLHQHITCRGLAVEKDEPSEQRLAWQATFPLPGEPGWDEAQARADGACTARRLALDHLLARQSVSPCFGVQGVIWGTDGRYYDPTYAPSAPALFTRLLRCKVVWWLDVGKSLMHRLGPGSRSFLVATLHRTADGFDGRASCGVTYDTGGDKTETASIAKAPMGAVRVGDDAGRGGGVFLSLHGHATAGPAVRGLRSVKVWCHDGGGARRFQLEAVVLVPLPADDVALDAEGGEGLTLSEDVAPSHEAHAAAFVRRLLGIPGLKPA